MGLRTEGRWAFGGTDVRKRVRLELPSGIVYVDD
jgi:hypothetical protein